MIRAILKKIYWKIPRPLRPRTSRDMKYHYHRLLEAWQVGRVKPKHDCFFQIVSCERNAGEGARKCLDSVYGQDYPKRMMRHVYIDDDSTDETHAIVMQWLDDHPDHSVEYIHNTARLGGCANTLTGFNSAPPGAIIVELNGDDWLPDNKALSFINNVYDDPDTWMTYNTLVMADGKPKPEYRFPVARHLIETNTYRENGLWRSSALQTFRQELLAHLKKENFIDPETGDYWESADDLATYYSLIELAGFHARHIYRTTYVFNYREESELNKDRSGTEDRAERIRKMPKYQPLKSLALINQKRI